MKLSTFCKGALALYTLGSSHMARGEFAYVTNFTSNTVSQIDTDTNTVTATIDVSVTGPNPYGIAVTPNGKSAYVAMTGNDSGTAIDLSSPGFALTNIPFTHIAGTQAVAISPDSLTAYFPERGGSLGNIETVDVPSNVQGTPVPIGSNDMFGIAILPNGLYGYATANDLSSLQVFSVPGSTLTDSIPLGSAPWDVAIATNGLMGYVTLANNTVVPFSTATNTLGTPIPVGNNPTALAITHDSKSAYVCNYNAGTVSHIDLTTGTVVATITVGNSPIAIAITADDSTAYVVNSLRVIPIDLATDTAGTAIVVDNTPTGIAMQTSFAAPPIQLSGIQTLNRFLFVGELFNTLTWQPGTTFLIASYRIYRNGTLIATVSGETFTYMDHDVTQGVSNTYAVTSVDINGNESAPATVVVP